MQWRVPLNGSDQSLNLLSSEVRGPSCTIERTDDGHYVMLSAAFEECSTPAQVMQQARVILDGILAALAFTEPGVDSDIRLGGVEGVHPDGRVDQSIFPEPVSMVVKVYAPTLLVDGRPPPSRLNPLTQLAANDPNVRDALVLRTKPATWTNLYNIHEIIQSDVGSIAMRGWATKATLERFTRTANHQGAAGLDARHVRSSNRPPPNPMSLGEAEQMIRSIVEQWIESKLGGGPPV